MNGELINYQTYLDACVPVSTLKEHYKILEDTLIGFSLEPWIESKNEKPLPQESFIFRSWRAKLIKSVITWKVSLHLSGAIDLKLTVLTSQMYQHLPAS